MLGLKVTINEGEPALCGAEDLSVLTAFVTLTGALGELGAHAPQRWRALGSGRERAC